MKNIQIVISGVVVLLAFVILSRGVYAEEAFVGKPAPNFTLTDTSGAPRSLSDYAGTFVVLEWNNPDCPFVRKHYDSGNMQSLQKKYTAEGVTWLMINSSAAEKQGHYSSGDHNKILQDRGALPTALLLDPDGKVGRLYGAKTTPHMFIVGADGNLVYNGAIDANDSAKSEDIAGAKNYVSSALDEAMAGTPVTEPQTKPYGCSVKYAD